MNNYKHLIFDLDGTLINPEAGILESLQYATHKMKIPFNSETQFLGFIGPPLHNGFKTVLGLSDEDADRAVTYFREKYGMSGMYRSTLYPGVKELIINLFERGSKLYLATSKYEVYALKILEYLKIDRYFTYVSGAAYKGKGAGKKELIGKVLAKVPKNEYSTCVMIGDTRYDIEGAKACGIDSLGVLYGYGTRDALEEAGANRIVGSVKELDEALPN